MRLSSILFLFIFSTILFSCGKKDPKEISEANASQLNKYQEYVSDVSSGMISVYDDVFVLLQNPVEGWSDNQELPEGILDISPSIEGRLVAIDNRTITFQPTKPFKEDTEYTFTLNLKDVIKDFDDDLDGEFSFIVKTLKQRFSVITDNIQSYSKDWQYIDGTLTTSDQLSFEIAKQLITATQEDKKVAINFGESTEKGRQFSFRIDSIKRFDEDSEVEVEWSGDDFDIDTEGKETLFIPGKKNFAVLGVSVSNVDKQYLEINFSDPLDKNQNFDGLVSIAGIANLKYSVEGNVLKVYPPREFTGVLEVVVFEGIKSIDDFRIKNKYIEKISFQQPKPEVRLLQSGVILPTSDNLKFNFEAINLNAVDVTVFKIYENNILQYLQNYNLSQ